MALLTETLSTSGLVTKNGVETLNNKTLASPVVSGNTDMNGNLDVDGNINFTGTARRITGDFSNAPVGNRLLFQTNITNGVTGVYAIPNGTAQIAAFTAAGGSDPANAPVFSLTQYAAESRLVAGASGTGAFTPITFYAGGSERLRIDTNGNVSVQGGTLVCGNGQTAVYPPAAIAVNPTTHATSKRAAISLGVWIIGQDSNGDGTQDFFLYDSSTGKQRLGISPNGNVLVIGGALGYGISAGGAVVQATSKSTAVTLNKVCGQITMHNAALAGGSSVRFILNNTFVNEVDEISVWLVNPINPIVYDVAVDGLGPGVVAIRLRNNTSTSYSDGVVLGFAVRKGTTS